MILFCDTIFYFLINLYKGENLEQIIKEWSFKNENNM